MRVNHLLSTGLLCACLAAFGCDANPGVVFEGQASAPQTAISPTPLPLPAKAFNDRLLVADNQTIRVNVLDNDEHNDGQVTGFGVGSDGAVGTVVRGEAGGEALLQSNGQLSYTPPAGDSPYRETYRYSIKNATSTSSATIQIERKLQVYLDDSSPTGGDGSKTRPFNTLRDALAAIQGKAAQINVLPGLGRSYGQELDEATLAPGQAILGLAPSADPPTLKTHLKLPSYDCVVTNLRFDGTGDARPSSPAKAASASTTDSPWSYKISWSNPAEATASR